MNTRGMGTPGSDAADRPKWLLSQKSPESERAVMSLIEPPGHVPHLDDLQPEMEGGAAVSSLLPWLQEHLKSADGKRAVAGFRVLPLPSGWGVAGVLLHGGALPMPWRCFEPLASAWGAAVAAAAQHEGSRRLGEQLAESNAALAEAQERLTRHASLARLGQMTAGAAHEMNNPLAVIAGRSQLLAMKLPPGSKEHQAATQVAAAADRLAELIRNLHLFAQPPLPDKRLVDLPSLLDEAVRRVHATPGAMGRRDDEIEISFRVRQAVPSIEADPQQVRDTVTELLHNAVQANPKGAVSLTVMRAADHVVIRVEDDGDGMEPQVLAHAFDPFFSAKPAGRRMGMGLARAQQWVRAHGGTLELHSTPGVGTVATLSLPIGVEVVPSRAA